MLILYFVLHVHAPVCNGLLDSLFLRHGGLWRVILQVLFSSVEGRGTSVAFGGILLAVGSQYVVVEEQFLLGDLVGQVELIVLIRANIQLLNPFYYRLSLGLVTLCQH